MKKMVIIVLSIMAAVSFATISEAVSDSETFTVSASVPNATGIAIAAYRVDPETSEFSPIAGTALSFDPLSYDNVNNIWVAPHIFAIDVTATGGAGTPTTTLTYTEGTNPNDPGHGLGWKSAATLVKVAGDTETVLGAHPPKLLLKDVNGEQVFDWEVVGGFLRIYLGIVTGEPGETPAGGEPFTNADAAGTYDGSLLVSATVP